MPAHAFAFFAGLAQENTREWFAAHREVYRACVDRPWRLLVEEVAAPLGECVPDLEVTVKAGRVLSRINLQWPRPGAAYRTGLRATFAPVGAPRRPPACLFVSLDAAGVRAGAEVAAATEEWRRVQQALAAGAAGPRRGGAGREVRWSVAGEAVDAAEAAERMRAARRGGSLRVLSSWGPDEASSLGPALAGAVWEALWGAVPVYLCAVGTADWAAWGAAAGAPLAAAAAAEQEPAGAAGPVVRSRAGRGDEAGRMPGAGSGPAPVPVPVEPETPAASGCDLPSLPRSLRQALAARASEEGVSVETLIVYALARAAAG